MKPFQPFKLKFPAWRCRGPDYEIRKFNAGNSDDELVGTNLNEELTNTPNNNCRCEASHGLPPSDEFEVALSCQSMD